MDFDQRVKKRTKKPKSLNMVHVKMAEENVDSRGCSKMRPQAANSGACIQHQDGAVRSRAPATAGSVTSVPDWSSRALARRMEPRVPKRVIARHCDASQNKCRRPDKLTVEARRSELPRLRPVVAAPSSPRMRKHR